MLNFIGVPTFFLEFYYRSDRAQNTTITERTSMIKAEILPKTPRSGGRIFKCAESVEISIY